MKTMILVSFFATVALAAPEARFIEIAVGQKFQNVENDGNQFSATTSSKFVTN